MYVIDLAAPFSAHEGFILMHHGYRVQNNLSNILGLP